MEYTEYEHKYSIITPNAVNQRYFTASNQIYANQVMGKPLLSSATTVPPLTVTTAPPSSLPSSLPFSLHFYPAAAVARCMASQSPFPSSCSPDTPLSAIQTPPVNTPPQSRS